MAGINRLTFDGRGSAGVGVRLERNPAISLQNTYSRLQDCIFKEMQTGFHQTNYEGASGLDSEFSILRCEFLRCTDAGVRRESIRRFAVDLRLPKAVPQAGQRVLSKIHSDVPPGAPH